MEKIKGYAGQQLRINLSKGQVCKEGIDPEKSKKYLGGAGYAAAILYEEMKADTEALSADNKFVVSTGPLTHPAVPGGGSLELCYKSPLTNCWAESRIGCNFGFALKQAGYDYIILEGKAKKASYLLINDDQVEVKPANNLLGETNLKKLEILKEELKDEDYQYLTIGPAGENLVLMATVMSGGRAAGRTGAGAVLGSKNILAIAVKGTKKVPVNNQGKFMEAIRKAHKTVSDNPDSAEFGKYGTTGDLPSCDELGDWPTKNWRSNSWGKADELYSHFEEKNLVTNAPCYRGCPVACGRVVKVNDGQYQTPQHDGAEYESITAFTAYVMNEDMDIAVHATYLCNEYGIDTISAGSAIAFLMDCYENDLLGEEEIDNLDLNWGNSKVLPVLVGKIAMREGVGNLLADGVKRAAAKIGNGAEELAIHGKGLEAPAHDPRAGKALAVTYGTGNRGMCHIHPVEAIAYDNGKMDFGLQEYGVPDPNGLDRWEEKDKGWITKLLQDGGTVPDIIGTCKFFLYVGLTLEDYAEILSGLTGWDITGKDLMLIGERVINLQRLFNIREGLSSKDDQLPERMKMLPEFGTYKDQPRCAISDYQGMLREYYQARGWDEESGVPKKEKLEELGI